MEQECQEAKQAAFHKRIPVDMRYMPEILGESYDNLVFEATARRCFSCGSCNLVCPTCYCFDVQEDVDWSMSKGERYRKWDGCMLTDFAAVAGGHNFRRRSEDRYRHRYYRKGQFIHDRYGDIACVGCGRCITACTANIANPVEIYNRLLEKNNELSNRNRQYGRDKGAGG